MLELSNTSRSVMPAITPAADQTVQSLVSAISQAQGVVNIGGGQVINGVKIPTSLTVSVRSNSGSGAVDTIVNLFNATIFDNQVTTNGSGANSIVYNWGDNTTNGKLYTELCRLMNNGMGIGIKGFNLACTFVDGTSNQQFFSTANVTILLNSLRGNTIPREVSVEDAVRNTAFNSGLLTVVQEMQLNTLMQMTLEVPVGCIVTLTMFTEVSSFKG